MAIKLDKATSNTIKPSVAAQRQIHQISKLFTICMSEVNLNVESSGGLTFRVFIIIFLGLSRSILEGHSLFPSATTSDKWWLGFRVCFFL